MKKFEEMGVDPEFVKSMIKKVKDVIAYQKGKNLTPHEIAAYAVGTHSNANFDPEALKKKIDVVTKIIDRINSGDLDISKFKKYAEYAKFAK